MPPPAVVHAWAPPTTNTTILVAADRLVVFQTPDGAPERGEMFDPALDKWIPIAAENAPLYGSPRDGPGPLGGARYFAFEDWVIVVWFDGNHRSQFSGAVFDARRNAWHSMDTAGMPRELEPAREVGMAGVWVRLREKGVDGGYRYDVRADRWSPIPNAGAGAERRDPAVVASGGRVVVWGGILGETQATGQVLDLATNAWKRMSTARAPSGRWVAWSAVRDGSLVVWSGRSASGRMPDLNDGGIYDIAADRWTPIPAAGAPNAEQNVDSTFLWWTGEALVDRELPPKAPASTPRRLAFWDPTVGRWWRSSVTTTWPVLPLGFGRILVVEGSPHVVHAREQLDCPVALALPIFAYGPTTFTATALIGDELVVWGRVDSPPLPACPAGAPCARFEPEFFPVDEGAVLSP
jgi:hypothetical protein